MKGGITVHAFNEYVREVFLRVLLVGAFSLIIPLLIVYFQVDSVVRLLEICVTSVFCLFGGVLLFGMKRVEKEVLMSFIRKRFVHK